MEKMHRKGEMEHHKMRARHKAANQKDKAREYSHHPSMADDRMVKEDHQEGIARVKQRHGDLDVGQHGKMTAHGDMAHWKRSGSKRTPREG